MRKDSGGARLRAFPLHEHSRLIEKWNHFEVLNHMQDHSTKEWSVVYEDNCDWIQAEEETQAYDKLCELKKAVDDYPILNEYEFSEMESGYINQAIVRKAEQSGTIIDSAWAVGAVLFDAEIPVVEEKPCHYEVIMSDEDFRQIVMELKE